MCYEPLHTFSRNSLKEISTSAPATISLSFRPIGFSRDGAHVPTGPLHFFRNSSDPFLQRYNTPRAYNDLQPNKGEQTMTSLHKLSIEGMHCGACARRVSSALHGLEGVSVDLVEIGSAEITLDPAKTSVEQVAFSLGRIGFHATLAR